MSTQTEPEAVQQGTQQLDINKVMGSLTRQIAQQAEQIAIKDAIIETQQEEIAALRQAVDEFGKSAQTPQVAPTRRTTPKKGKAS